MAEFARKCSIGDSLIRKYLDGAEPGLDKVTRIWYAEQCSLSWLVAGEGDPYLGTAYGRGAAQERATYEVLDSNFIRVPHYDVKASAGLGAESTDEPIKRFNYFRRDWWERELARPEGKCFSTDVVGDSMSPYLTDRHVPIFYSGENEVRSEAVYIFRLDGDVFVKYLERIPGRGLIARSANERYTPWEIGDGSQYSEFKVIGRLVFKQLGERV